MAKSKTTLEKIEYIYTDKSSPDVIIDLLAQIFNTINLNKE